jgi:hypothetical protein
VERRYDTHSRAFLTTSKTNEVFHLEGEDSLDRVDSVGWTYSIPVVDTTIFSLPCCVTLC